MDWKTINLAPGSKLYKVHNYNLMHQGTHFSLEIDEFSDETFTGHGEHSTDKNYVIESVSGVSVEDCLENLIKKIQERTK